MISRRRLLQFTAAGLPAARFPSALAQQFPNRPIRLIVPASAGATVDVTGRFVAEALARRVNASVVVDNRPGAGGALGSEVVAKAPPDGYTLGFVGIVHFSARYSGESGLTYDPVKDFVPVAKVASAALAIVVPAASPYKTLGDLVRAMKANPGEINYGSGGAGSTSHLCTLILNNLTQTTAKHIPYKGNTQAVTDTASGIVAFTCQGSGGVLPLIKAGKLRALAVTSKMRWDAQPEVPTGIESGIADFEVSSWMAAIAPAATPAAAVALLSTEIVRIARSPEFKDLCDKQSMFVDIADQRDFQAEWPREDIRWKRVSQLAKEN